LTGFRQGLLPASTKAHRRRRLQPPWATGGAAGITRHEVAGLKGVLLTVKHPKLGLTLKLARKVTIVLTEDGRRQATVSVLLRA